MEAHKPLPTIKITVYPKEPKNHIFNVFYNEYVNFTRKQRFFYDDIYLELERILTQEHKWDFKKDDIHIIKHSDLDYDGIDETRRIGKFETLSNIRLVAEFGFKTQGAFDEFYIFLLIKYLFSEFRGNNLIKKIKQYLDKSEFEFLRVNKC